MPSEETRRRAGGAGIQTAEPPVHEVAKRAEKARGKNLNSAQTQRAILRPPQLDCTLEFDSGESKKISIPLEYSIADIFNRGVLEDLDAYAMLVRTEIFRVAPDLQTVGPDLLSTSPGYFEAAMAKSNVRKTLREILARIARVQRDDEIVERPSLADIENGLSELDYYVCAIRLFNESLRRRDQQAKNRSRTARA